MYLPTKLIAHLIVLVNKYIPIIYKLCFMNIIYALKTVEVHTGNLLIFYLAFKYY